MASAAFLQPQGVFKISEGSHPKLDTSKFRLELEDHLKFGGASPSTAYAEDEFVVFLKKSKTHKFDESAVRRVFAEISGAADDERPRISCQRFVDSYCCRLEKLHNLSSCLLADVNELDLMIDQCETNLRVCIAANQQSVSREAAFGKLILQILKANQFDPIPDEKTMYSIHIECGKEAIETHQRPFSRESGVFWNDLVSFTIDNRDAEVVLTLHAEGGSESRVECRVKLADLWNQRKTTLTKDFWGGAEACQLTLVAQWIHDKQSFWKGYIREFMSTRDSKEREQVEQNFEYCRLSDPLTTRANDKSMSQQMGDIVSGDFVAEKIDAVLHHLKLSNYQKSSQIFVAISIVLCCIASYARPLFLDLLIGGFAFWCNIDPKRWTSTRYAGLMWAVAVATVLDGIWILNFFPAWSEDSGDLYNVTRIFTLFNLLWRLILFNFFWKCRHDMVKSQQRLVF